MGQFKVLLMSFLKFAYYISEICYQVMSYISIDKIEIEPQVNYEYQLNLSTSLMLTQNPLSVTLESESTSDDEAPQRHIDLLFRNIINKTSKIPVFNTLNQRQNKTQSTAQSIGTGKMIGKKMRIKLINWMQKLSMETFDFSIDTTLLAIKLLDQYLCLTNESPAQLQLIGCAALYLAAKTFESVIVAGQCYVTASANCFTEDQLMSKQMEIYKTLNCNTTFSSLSRVYKYMKSNQISSNLTNYIKKDIDLLFLDIAKNLDFLQWRQHKIVSMLIAIVQVKNQLPQSSKVLEMLQSNSAC